MGTGALQGFGRMIKNQTIFTGDNLPIMRGMESESIDLIYLDPPFNSKKQYAAPIGSKAAGAEFKDTWTLDDMDEGWLTEIKRDHPGIHAIAEAVGLVSGNADKSYLVYMAIRLLEMHRILKPTGSLYLHCDPTMSHSLKLLLDAIFGDKSFKNEIVWCYKKWSVTAGQFVRNHDVILFYAGKNHIFNPQFIDPSPGTMKRWKGQRQQAVFVDGVRQATSSGNKAQAPCPDWWEISILNPNAKERTGYPTQKPLALLRRIVLASSNPGDWVLDPFCGCATTCLAAMDENRNWIGIDISPKAFELINQRMKDEFQLFGQTTINRTDIPEREVSRSKGIRAQLFAKQKGKCRGCNQEFYYSALELDHIVPRSKGGQDGNSNLQLLCGRCNRVKGDRPMAYLLAKMKDERAGV